MTALLVLALSAGTVRAECGDYVHVRPSGQVELATASPVPASNPSAPCDGPNCAFRNTPGMPAAPAPIAPAGPAQPDAILNPLTDPDPAPARRVRVASFPLPSGPVADMFRPPRAA